MKLYKANKDLWIRTSPMGTKKGWNFWDKKVDVDDIFILLGTTGEWKKLYFIRKNIIVYEDEKYLSGYCNFWREISNENL